MRATHVRIGQERNAKERFNSKSDFFAPVSQEWSQNLHNCQVWFAKIDSYILPWGNHAIPCCIDGLAC